MDEDIFIDTNDSVNSDSSSSNEITTYDFSSLIEQQEKLHNDINTFGIVFSCFYGLLVALMIVLIFVKGYQSNAK